MNFGKTIAELRIGRGLSQEALADRLFVSRNLVSKWENGTRRPDYPMIETIAAFFGVSADDILGRDELLFDDLADCLPEGVELSEEELTAHLNAFFRDPEGREARLFMERYYYLKSTAEIASAHGIRENHVRSCLSKTRKKLKRYLKGVVS